MNNKQQTPIKRFISNVVKKEYSLANTSLQDAIENKIKERVKTSLTQKNFQK